MVFVFSGLVLVLGGVHLVELSFQPIQISPALGLPMGFIYSVLPISGLLLCFYSMIECLSEFSFSKWQLNSSLKLNKGEK